MAEIAEEYQLQLLAYDRWRINDFRRELEKIGSEIPMQPFGQGFRDMSPAVDKVEQHVAERKLRHGGNPILNMCAAGAVVQSDPAGNRKLHKSNRILKLTASSHWQWRLVLCLPTTSLVQPVHGMIPNLNWPCSAFGFQPRLFTNVGRSSDKAKIIRSLYCRDMMKATGPKTAKIIICTQNQVFDGFLNLPLPNPLVL